MIDMTKTYKTRDGRDVRILCVDGPDKDCPVVGVIAGNGFCDYWRTNGVIVYCEASLDLIEVKPKIVVEKWVNIIQYPNGSIDTCFFRDRDYSESVSYVEGLTVLARAVPFYWEGEQ